MTFFARPWAERSLIDKLCLVVVVMLVSVITHHVFQSHAIGVLLAVNQLITPTWVMKKIGMRWTNNIKFGANVQRSYDDQYKQAGAKVGYTVNARLPQRYQVNKGQALIPQPVIDNIVPITLTDQANVGLEFSTASLTMEVDDYNEKCIAPAVDALVNAVDSDGLSRAYKAISQVVGTPGVVPGSTGTLPQAANKVYLLAKTKLDNAAIPPSGRIGIFSSDMHANLVNANATVFNPTATIAAGFREGEFMRDILGMSRLFMDQNVFSHTVGVLGGTPVVNGAGQVGASLVTNGWTAAAAQRLNQGDVIQIGNSASTNVDGVNPLSYVDTGKVRDFVVTAPTSSDGAGNMTIPIDPPITTTGAYQTVVGSPANGAAINIFGDPAAYASLVTPQGLVYHPQAFALVFADLELPGGLWVAQRLSNKALGVALRFLKGYDIMTDLSPARVDELYGWATIRPEAACRVCS